MYSANPILYRVLTMGFGGFGAWVSWFSSSPALGESLGLAKFTSSVWWVSPGLGSLFTEGSAEMRNSRAGLTGWMLKWCQISLLIFLPRVQKELIAVQFILCMCVLLWRGSGVWAGSSNNFMGFFHSLDRRGAFPWFHSSPSGQLS